MATKVAENNETGSANFRFGGMQTCVSFEVFTAVIQMGAFFGGGFHSV
jgi:hypothetical protein